VSDHCGPGSGADEWIVRAWRCSRYGSLVLAMWGRGERERGRCGSSDVALGGHGEVADSADNNVEERCRMKLGAPVLQGATCRRDDMRRERRPRGLNRSDS
jgi:hypothetical protein